MEQFILWLVDGIWRLGYPGIVALMAMESSIIPIPSELVMPPAGYLVSQGAMNGWLVVLAGTLGSIIGALANYTVSHYVGRPLIIRYGKYFLLSAERFEQVTAFFNRHGEISTFSGRFVPVIRHLISIPAGLARMNLPRFILYTGVGSGIWVAVLTYIGYLVGNNKDLVIKYSHQVTVIALIGLVVLIGLYVLFHKRRTRFEAKEE